jgi:hypothetical protein
MCAAGDGTALPAFSKERPMTNTSYTTSFTVPQMPAEVTAAIGNPRAWWSESIEGVTDKVGAVWKYHFRDIHRCTIKVTEMAPGRIVWHVLENDFNFIADKSEWVDTHLVFDVARKGEGTEVRFTHVGLVPDYECYEICDNAWGTYVGSLKSLITTGTGFPNVGEPVTEAERELSADTFSRTIRVGASPEAVFAAVNDPRAWWSGAFEGGTAKLGDVFTYRYSDIHYSKQEVTELVPGKRVAWHVLECDLTFLKDRTEWTGTTITFDIAAKDGMTELVFTHVGLKPVVECYDVCSDAWTSLITGSLKQLIETGKGSLPDLEASAA